MPDISSNPLSYQTTMPEYPDVSYENYERSYNFITANRLGHAIEAWSSGMPSYKTWRTNLLDEYNAKMSAYNTWLQTGEGIAASAESGGYNKSYFQNGAASASPLNYQEIDENSGFSEAAQGISGIFSFAQALQGMKMVSEQIAGQELKNEAQKINNQYLAQVLGGRVEGLTLKNDRAQFELETLFYPRWSHRPDLWKGGVFSPYGRGTYDLRDAERGLGYQRAVADLDYLKAGKTLRDSQTAVLNASKREKQWFYDNVFEIQKDILSHSRDLLKGQYDFQKTEQKLRKAGIYANIGVGVINAAVNAVKSFTPASLFGQSNSPIGPSFNPPFVSGSSWTPGVDITTGDIYGSYGF